MKKPFTAAEKAAYIEEQQNRVKSALEEMENGVRALIRSGRYDEVLRFYSRFHHYSFNNSIMILLQRPTATRCASFDTWKKQGRNVRKGEKGLKVLVPIPHKAQKTVKLLDQYGNVTEEEKEFTWLSFKLGNVFDVSQTDGDDMPTLCNNLTLDSDTIGAAVNNLSGCCGFPVTYDEALKNGSSHGYYMPKENRIALKPGMSDLQTLKTLCHEISHAIQETEHKEEIEMLTYADCEVIAESTAFCVLHMLSSEYGMPELDSSEYSFGYVAGWGNTEDYKQLHTCFDMISKISNQIFDMVKPSFAA